MISSSEYLSITEQIGRAQNDANASLASLGKMQFDVNESPISSSQPNKLDLLAKISTAYNIILSRYIYPSSTMKTFLITLQTYITNESGSVDNFLSENNIKVSQSFADLSALVGYRISQGNIYG